MTFLGPLGLRANEYNASPEVRSLVFDMGDGGSKFFRIPALTVLPDGAVIAVADRRWDSLKDLPARIDVVCRRSDDGGRSWHPTVAIAANDSTGGYGDPAIAVDPLSGDLLCVMTHGNGLWESTPEDHATIMTSRSSDGGYTWSAPTPMVFNNELPPMVSSFASSGAMAVTKDGRMMFVLVVRDDIKKWSKLKAFAVWSADGGRTWTIAPHAADLDGDESKIVELSDGRLLMSIRNRRKGEHKFSVSADKGRSWSEPRHCPDIIEPGCNSDIIRSLDGALFLSIPNNPEKRRDLTLFTSTDEGESWSPLRILCPAPAAYSSMTFLPDGSLGILSEEGSSDGGWRIWFTNIKIQH